MALMRLSERHKLTSRSTISNKSEKMESATRTSAAYLIEYVVPWASPLCSCQPKAFWPSDADLGALLQPAKINATTNGTASTRLAVIPKYGWM